MKRIQNFYLYCYRLIGFIFLAGLIISILWYSFSVIFFLTSSSWSMPLILSPNQENVLVHQEYMMNVKQELLKNQTELATKKNALDNKRFILKNTEELQLRFEKSMEKEAEDDAKNSKIYAELAQKKAANLAELTQFAKDIEHKNALIDKDLKMGIITKEEALSEHLALNNLRLTLVDAKVKMHELEQRSVDFDTSSLTLQGSAANLDAMSKISKKMELTHQILQLKSEIFSLNITIDSLEKIIKKHMEVLSLIKQSPYILATKSPIHVAFVPYKNLAHVKMGLPVYSCYLDMMFCYQSGHITQLYKDEEYTKHPLFKSDIKGEFIGIAFNHEKDAQKKLLFINGKPLFI